MLLSRSQQKASCFCGGLNESFMLSSRSRRKASCFRRDLNMNNRVPKVEAAWEQHSPKSLKYNVLSQKASFLTNITFTIISHYNNYNNITYTITHYYKYLVFCCKNVQIRRFCRENLQTRAFCRKNLQMRAQRKVLFDFFRGTKGNITLFSWLFPLSGKKRKFIYQNIFHVLYIMFIYYVIQFGGLGRSPPPCNIVMNWADPPTRLCNTVINRVDPVKLRFLQNST